jgi:hypothetical protein
MSLARGDVARIMTLSVASGHFFMRCVLCLVWLLWAAPVHAGAFLQREGMLLTIHDVAASQSRGVYGAQASPYKNMEGDTSMELGVISWFTLLTRVQSMQLLTSTDAQWRAGPRMAELGGRLRLWQSRDYIVSTQLVLRQPDVISPQPGALYARDWRIMLGRSFDIYGWPAFWSLAPGLRQRGGGAKDEIHLEITAGSFVADRWQVIGQGFSLWRQGNGLEPGGYQHKLQGSLIFNAGRAWSLEAGYFFTLAGHQMREEAGWKLALWRRM